MWRRSHYSVIFTAKWRLFFTKAALTLVALIVPSLTDRLIPA